MKAVIAGVLLALGLSPAFAQYPNKPIRVIIAQAPGSATDVISRVVGNRLSEALGQPIVVEARPGAGGALGTEAAARSAPDGYTLFMANNSTHGSNPALYSKLPYDAVNDFAPISMVASVPYVLVVEPSLPVNSVQELIGYAKKNPDQLSYASTGNGSSIHVGMELFKLMTGTRMVHVPFKAAVIAITDLTAGRVQVMADNINSIGPHVKANRLRGLAVTSATRVPAFSNLPTVAEAGVPGFDVVAWAGVIVPVGVPKPIVQRLNAELNKALATPAVGDKLPELGLVVAGGTPEQFSDHIRKEAARWADVVKRSGAKME